MRRSNVREFMVKELPDNMDDLAYFTRRKFSPEKGSAVAWVARQPCSACKKGLMAKPKDEKKGTFKIRATEYVCPSCGHSEEKEEHEAKLTCEILYTCPFCNHKGEADVPYVRKSWYGAKAVVFPCAGCNEKLGVTKKLNIPEKFLQKL